MCVWASTDYILWSPPFSTNGNICCCYSVTQSCLILYDPMHGSTPGLPVRHQLLELTQTHVHWVGDAIQPSHLLSSPSLPAFNLSQHHGLFKWISSLHQVAKVLEFQLQPSVLLMNIQEWFPLGWTGWISFQSKELSRVFSSTTVQKPQFFGTQLSSHSYPCYIVNPCYLFYV